MSNNDVATEVNLPGIQKICVESIISGISGQLDRMAVCGDYV